MEEILLNGGAGYQGGGGGIFSKHLKNIHPWCTILRVMTSSMNVPLHIFAAAARKPLLIYGIVYSLFRKGVDAKQFRLSNPGLIICD